MRLSVVFDVAGTYYYDFVVTNNFGCRQDTTVEMVK